MDFTLIQGTYHLVGRTAAGRPTGFEPDGDSIHFRPARPALLDRLARVGRSYTLTNIGSTQLRLEGVDALELHYRPTVAGAKETHQPRPLADQARDHLTGLLGMNPVPYAAPRSVRVSPPVPVDAVPGFILTRTLEVNGRPVSFAFAGGAPAADGAQLALTRALLRQSLNYRLIAAGHVYPMFYDGLRADLRNRLTTAVERARAAKRGLWRGDRTQRGVRVAGQASLEADGVIFPKLFRRLSEYLAERPGAPLAGLPAWLIDERPERVLDIREMNFVSFGELVRVRGEVVSLSRRPEGLVFVSAA